LERRLIRTPLLFLFIVVPLLIIASAAWMIASELSAQQNQIAVETAVANALAREAPTLLFPDDGATFDNVAEVVLRWQYKRPLTPDEAYDVRVWREGEPPNGITFTADSEFKLLDWLLYQTAGDFNWSVSVARQDASGTVEVTDLAPPRRFTMTDLQLGIFEVPDGFHIELAARLPFDYPTVILRGADDAMYILSQDGYIARLVDETGDGLYSGDEITLIFANSNGILTNALGMAFLGDDIYVSDAGRISIITDGDSDGIYDTVTPIIEGLPTWAHPYHSNNGIAFGPDDKLYITVGSTTDHGPLQDPLEASILRVNPDGTELEVYATGLRNPYDLVFSPTGELFTADNNPDNMDADLQYLPPEELNLIVEGADYGFPNVYGFPSPGESSQAPVTEFFSSVASAGLTYYAADQFPPEYHGVFVAQFGSGASFPTSVGVTNGYMVVHVGLKDDGDGGYVGEWQPFARARLDLDKYSPINVAVAPDGALLIMEWTTATVHRVTYVGDGTETLAEMSAMLTETTSTEEAVHIAIGELLYHQGSAEAPSCVSCHRLDGATGIGPSLVGIAETAANRVAGLDATAYLRQSIVDPDSYVVEGYQSGIMYRDYGDALTDYDVDALVSYVLSLGAQE
jgi:glucose/arabinose dehydrogenase/mono/diheme cytochrome c family protein